MNVFTTLQTLVPSVRLYNPKSTYIRWFRSLHMPRQLLWMADVHESFVHESFPYMRVDVPGNMGQAEVLR